MRMMHSYVGRERGGDERYFLAVNVRNPEGLPMQERVFQGKAEKTPDFVMGSKEWWGGMRSFVSASPRA